MCSFCDNIESVAGIPDRGESESKVFHSEDICSAVGLSRSPNKGCIGFDLFPRRPYPLDAITIALHLNIVKKDSSFCLVASSHAEKADLSRKSHDLEWNRGDTMVVSQIFYCPYCGEKLMT